VLTLPPVRQSSENGKPVDPSFDRAKYDAIGESDRMTLKFVKPNGADEIFHQGNDSGGN
jgi:predicted methyltransferase